MDRAKKLFLAYISGKASFEQLENWFAPLYVRASNGEEPELDMHVIRNVALSIAEFTNGEMSEGELKADIRKYVGIGPTLKLVFQAPPQVTTAASPASLTERQLAFA